MTRGRTVGDVVRGSAGEIPKSAWALPKYVTKRVTQTQNLTPEGKKPCAQDSSAPNSNPAFMIPTLLSWRVSCTHTSRPEWLNGARAVMTPAP